MLATADSELPEREAALARFAVTLTAQPWALTGDTADELAGQGFDDEAVEASIAVIVMFNYLTRVADASGIEFDYDSPLPAFQPQRQLQPVALPEEQSWPVAGQQYRTFRLLPTLADAWGDWRAYLLDSAEPLDPRQRRLLARVAALACGDRWRADQLGEYRPGSDTDEVLAAFAHRLSRQPWQMRPADLDGLRAEGLSEKALLHVIAVTAHQNAESRLALGRALLRR